MIRRLAREDGAVPAVELAIGAPVLAVMIWLVIWAGSGGQTPGAVSMAANDAARVAAAVDPSARHSRATQLVNQRLADSDCRTWSTSVGWTDDTVTVNVYCGLRTDQQGMLNIGSRTVHTTGRASIDPFTERNTP